ncbi:M14 family zinc carboxypeptidase [Kitasatospora sp. NBC_01287]|uniref:M14 family zinc carboxypeptidase n=1 Tax=Kitasatospora sp. NBC_01287 TaxID=2903573 RepID=UPI00225449AC|nr:M14 family zinc carboxypeptidase [Kitasatospora sp. NBC_01287]MCX4744600.1 M14 family zinc carboxypeptidase [Kitasatospora sp. NBC_01287]
MFPFHTSTAAGRAVVVHDRYPTLDAVVEAAQRLAAARPRECRLRVVGSSRGGRPLHLLSVGHGSDQVLVVAGAHANEPVGGATVVELAHRVLAEPDRLAGIAWNFLLCADPDGAFLAQGEGRHPSELLGHLLDFFRPVPEEQPEWAPSTGVLLPESRVLLGLIEELRPFLQVSLHGSEVGGTFLQATRELPGLAEPFARSAAGLGIPVDAGPYDTLYWPSVGSGVYLMPPVAEVELSAPASWAVGTTTWHAPHRFGGATVIVEVPLWVTERVADTTPLACPAPGLTAAADRLRQRGRLLGELLAAAAPHLGDGDDPLLRSARGHQSVCAPLADEWDPRVRQPQAQPMPPMTAARQAGLELWAHRLPLRAAAMLRRLLAPAQSGTGALHSHLERLIEQWCAEYQACFSPVWLPVARQVEQQISAVRAAVEIARPR